MIIKNIIRSFFRVIKKMEEWSIEPEKASIYREPDQEEEERRVFFSVWDALQFKENTQAYHLNSVIGFEEWIDMEEIRRRINDLFDVEYKNFRSLYPYLKTLVDVGLMETTSAGGRRKWRKVALIVPVSKEQAKKEEIVVENKKKEKLNN